MDALAASHDAAVQMIDTSVVRVHQHGGISGNNHQAMGRSRGGLKLAANYLAFVKLASIRIWLRASESTP